jgi:hypothetical protein
MTTDRHKQQLKHLLDVFRSACRVTELDWMESGLLAALDVAQDARKTQAERLREIRQRLRLLRLFDSKT